MTSEEWKAWCLSIANMKGYVPKVLQIRPERTHVCDKCAMEWVSGMQLEGKKHSAIQNQCGGTWREKTAQAVEGSPAPFLINGEEYEMET